MTEITVTADRFEFSFGRQAADSDETITHLALHAIEGDVRNTLAMPLDLAEQVGKLLVGHTDYVAGRPPRDW